MKRVILFTNMSSVAKYWRDCIIEKYQPIPIDKFENLIAYLEENDPKVTILFDEMSVSNIVTALRTLKEYRSINLLLFNAVPEVYHASTLLNEGINGYENTFIAKKNLLRMIECTKDKQKWLFSELVYFIINQYAHDKAENKLDFMSDLTEKEKEISLMVADGLSNKEIAQKMKVALSTVKGHLHHIFEKTGVSDRISLALKFK